MEGKFSYHFYFLSIGILTLGICENTDNIPPNILLIVADDYGWNDIGYHGSEIKTPNLDALAASGVTLDNYYVQPICTPTRSQLMSGRYQIHTGLQHGVIHPMQPHGLPTDIPTMADMLKGQGYSTHIVGKWHLGEHRAVDLPTNRGFDSHYGYWIGAEGYYNHSLCQKLDGKEYCGYDFRHNMEVLRDVDGKYSTHLFTEHAAMLVQNHTRDHADKPLLLYLPYQAVHGPMEVPQKYKKPYAFIDDKLRRTYAGMVSAMDEGIGNITQVFKDHHLWENTIMIFTTDNGGAMPGGGRNWPLKGQKGDLWEGGVRGVGFVSGNINKARSGSVCRELMHVSDWFPTLIHMAGGDTSSLSLDGFDIWKTINEGQSSPRKELLHNIDPLFAKSGQKMPGTRFDTRTRAAIRVGDWKLLTGNAGRGPRTPPPTGRSNVDLPQKHRSSTYSARVQNLVDMIANRNDELVLSANSKEKEHKESHLESMQAADVASILSADADFAKTEKDIHVWLFNVKVDPMELHDLSSVYPERVHDMLDKLADYEATAVPCHYNNDDPAADPALQDPKGVWGPWLK